MSTIGYFFFQIVFTQEMWHVISGYVPNSPAEIMKPYAFGSLAAG